ncbi:MAG: flagellar filament capping protein FliD [Phycisphaerae bacterium]|nr:flagellar filament capping protein FliD [Phycisphaerae bacterium]
MGTFSSGVGLVSGFDIQSYVDQIMAIEGRTRDQVQNRKDDLSTQQEALMKLQAEVMAVQLSAANFNKQSIFEQKIMTSSDEEALTATATKYAVEGNYKLNVVQLASYNNLVSRGFASMDTGIGTGTLSFEIGKGQVAKPTDLGLLNGQQGVQRGKIKITDRAGNSSQIDLTTVLDVQDILDKINENDDIKVKASVSGGHIVLEDYSGGTSDLAVNEVGNGHTAEDLGILGSSSVNKLQGSDILYISNSTQLSLLNDGNGIRGIGDGLDDLAFTRADGQVLEVELRDTLYEIAGSNGENSQNSNLLRSLNRGAGVRAGEFRIKDRNGSFFTVEITEAMAESGSLGDLKNIIEQTASEKGMDLTVSFNSLDHIEIRDNSKPTESTTDGERNSNFIIEDIDGSLAAKDLGIVKNIAGEKITGSQIWYMDTVEDVINSVNNHWENRDGGITLDINSDQTGFVATDYTGNPRTSSIQIGIPEGTNGKAALDLGLITPENHEGVVFEGSSLISGLNTVMLKSLNGGTGGNPESGLYGISAETEMGIVSFSDHAGNEVELDFAGIDTLTGVIEKINSAANTTGIIAAFNDDGTGIVLTDNSIGTNNMVIADTSGDLATELNFAIDTASASIDSNGKTVAFTDRDGNQVELDFAGTVTLQDVIDRINSDDNTTNITAEINSSGNGIILKDSSTGNGDMAVADIDNSIFATNLNITGSLASNSINSGNLQLQYVSEASELGDLRQGQGISRGKFEITDGLGNKAVIDLQKDGLETVGDIIKQINLNTTKIKARINDNGDGIILEDFSEGDTLLAMKIKDTVGNVAKELGFLANSAKLDDEGKYYIDGSYEVKIEVGGGDSIQDIMDMVNRTDMGVKATVVNDGQNYRLNFISEISGEAGNIYMDTGGTTLKVDTLQNGKDAIILMGDESNEHPMLIRSSDNVVKEAIKGVTLDLAKAGTGTIELGVKQNIEGVVSSIASFVEAYNAVMTDISELTKFNVETYEKGILFADNNVSNVKNSMINMIQRTISGLTGDYNRLSSIGVTFASAGSETGTDASGKTVSYAVAGSLKIKFDDSVFREAFAADADAVAELFTKTDVGVGDYIADKLESIASTSMSSTLKNALETMSSQQKMYDSRIEYLEDVLSTKEDRMYTQFYAMEEAIAKLQSQQSSISNIGPLQLND